MKWIYIGLSLVFLGLAVVASIRSDEPLRIIVHPRVYSMVPTDPLDSLQVTIATNQAEDYRFQNTYVEYVSLLDDQHTMAMDLSSIRTTGTYWYHEEELTLVQFILIPSVSLSHTQTDFLDATLDITYANGETLSLALGDVHILFDPLDGSSLSLGGLQAIYEDIEGIETVGGLELELVHPGDGWITIRAIEVVAEAVQTNPAMVQTGINCPDGGTVADCLALDTYAFHLPRVDEPLSILLGPSQQRTIVIPFLYQDVVPFHRFAIVVTYSEDDQLRQMVLDDFPFLISDPFQPAYEAYYVETIIDSD